VYSLYTHPNIILFYIQQLTNKIRSTLQFFTLVLTPKKNFLGGLALVTALHNAAALINTGLLGITCH